MTILRRSDRWNIGSLRPRHECDYVIPSEDARDSRWNSIIMFLVGVACAIAILV